MDTGKSYYHVGELSVGSLYLFSFTDCTCDDLLFRFYTVPDWPDGEVGLAYSYPGYTATQLYSWEATEDGLEFWGTGASCTADDGAAYTILVEETTASFTIQGTVEIDSAAVIGPSNTLYVVARDIDSMVGTVVGSVFDVANVSAGEIIDYTITGVPETRLDVLAFVDENESGEWDYTAEAGGTCPAFWCDANASGIDILVDH